LSGKLKKLFECGTCGRFDIKPLTPHHFHPDSQKGVCGAPTVAVEYRRIEKRTYAREGEGQ
jgi:hypothetical protein